MYERAYEAFVLDMATKYVQDADIRARLRRLAGPGDDHGARIAAQIDRLNRELRDVDRASIERAALQDVIAVERAAREFYLKFVEELHDPRVADLFRDLAREEAAHVVIAEDALALNDRKSGRPRLSRDAERMLRMMEDERFDEASDLGISRKARTGP